MKPLLKIALLISLATLAMPGCSDGKCLSGDCQNGYGIWKYLGNSYEGDFVEGSFNGKGVYTSTNGDQYEGDFVNGKWHGKGAYTSTFGDQYEGDYRNGNRHGKGAYTTTLGRQFGRVKSGIWENDEFVRTDAQDHVYNECLLEKGKEQDMSVSAVLAAVQSVCQSIAVGNR